MMGIFGRDKKVDTKEAVRELQRRMRAELRQLDRQIHAIEREEMKVYSWLNVWEVFVKAHLRILKFARCLDYDSIFNKTQWFASEL